MRLVESSLVTIHRVFGLFLVMLALTGCAHLPDATVHYYLPKTDVSFKVVRVLTCDAKNNVLAADSIIPTVTHSADHALVRSVSLAQLKGAFSDSDVKFDFYDDGRLQGFNGVSTGQGEAILKTVISIAAAALPFDTPTISGSTVCADIKKVGDEKPLVLTYQGTIDLGDKTAQELMPETSNVIVDQYKLQPAIGKVYATVLEQKAPAPRTSYKTKEGDILLPLREPGLANVKVTTGDDDTCTHNTIWEEYLTVAQFGTPYDLPLPPAVIFGKRALGASFSESGALKTVQFTSETGTGQALNVLSAAQTATAGKTTAEKAAAIQAEADLIAQQQRLLQCLADPKNCK